MWYLNIDDKSSTCCSFLFSFVLFVAIPKSNCEQHVLLYILYEYSSNIHLCIYALGVRCAVLDLTLTYITDSCVPCRVSCALCGVRCNVNVNVAFRLFDDLYMMSTLLCSGVCFLLTNTI